MENRASSLLACWTVFTELLPGNALIKSVKGIDHLQKTGANKNSKETQAYMYHLRRETQKVPVKDHCITQSSEDEY
jgi:hypothetical protein